MKLYIAGPWIERNKMPAIAKQFEDAGHRITWKWWETEDIKETEDKAHELQMQAINDYMGVCNAERLILVNSVKSEGKAVEQGLALAQHKTIIAIGQRGVVSLNVFHYLPAYTWVDTVEEAIKCLRT